MRIVGMIVTGLIILMGIAFSALNAKAVTINYLIGSKELPLAVILLVTLCLGALLSMLFIGFNLLKLKAKNKWLENKLKQTQAQIVQGSK